MMESRNWLDLPSLALFSVLLSLPDLPDLFSFAGVCRAWRSFLRSVAPEIYLSSRPPLLLFPPYSQSHRRLFPLSPNTTASDFRLHALDHRSTSFKSLLPDETLATPCLGYSHGHLLLLRRREVLLADVLTGAEIHAPTLPPDRYSYYYAALTAPPSSPDCRILLFYSRYALLCCRLGDPYPGWTKLRLQPFVSYIARVLSFNGRIVAVDQGAKLLAFDFDPDFGVEMLKAGGLRLSPAKDGWESRPQLVECGGELLLVLLRTTRIDVYRLDFGRMVWVEVENLGDFSLFIDFGGKCPVSCANPGSWGGRSNCIYLAGPDCTGWKRYSLDRKSWKGYSPDGKPIRSGSSINLFDIQPRSHWPSPIWVYPGLFFGP